MRYSILPYQEEWTLQLVQFQILVSRVWRGPIQSRCRSTNQVSKATRMNDMNADENSGNTAPRKLLHLRMDAAVDNALEHIRDNKIVIVIFSIASAVGDFGLLWHIIGLVRSIGSIDRLQQALVFSILIGLESLILNQGIKRLFRRTRPTERGDTRFALRKPRTSSFPSGHSSSAFFSALVLTYFTAWPWWLLFYTFALIITTSRVGVRIHHASDVIAGAFAGTLMGVVGLLVLRHYGV
jgi:undecaprenyl-diphosphatase